MIRKVFTGKIEEKEERNSLNIQKFDLLTVLKKIWEDSRKKSFVLSLIFFYVFSCVSGYFKFILTSETLKNRKVLTTKFEKSKNLEFILIFNPKRVDWKKWDFEEKHSETFPS